MPNTAADVTVLPVSGSCVQQDAQIGSTAILTPHMVNGGGGGVREG